MAGGGDVSVYRPLVSSPVAAALGLASPFYFSKRASGRLISAPMESAQFFKSSISKTLRDRLSGSSVKPPIKPFNCSKTTTLNSLPNRCLSTFRFCIWLSTRLLTLSSPKGPRASLCLLDLQRLLKLCSTPELVPVQYGGLSREGEQEFTSGDVVTEEIIKPATKYNVNFPVTEWKFCQKSTLFNDFDQMFVWRELFAAMANTVAAVEHGIAVLTAMVLTVAQADASIKAGFARCF